MAAPGGKPGILSLHGSGDRDRRWLQPTRAPVDVFWQQCREKPRDAGTRDPGASAAMSRHDVTFHLHGSSLEAAVDGAPSIERQKPHESRESGDGPPSSPGSRDPEARVDRDVTPFEGVRGDPATKARIGSGGYELWRGETPRRDRRPARGELALRAPASARTRRGMKALETALLRKCAPSGSAWTSEVTAGGHGAPRGVPIAVEGNPLQGEAHGCSSTLRRAGRRVALKGVRGRKASWWKSRRR
jgi:hypothetical protein